MPTTLPHTLSVPPAARPRVLTTAPLAAPLARPHETLDVWQLTVGDHEEALADAQHVLDATERRRWTAFRSPADRDRYAAAHLALRRLLGSYLDIDPADVVLGREPCPLCAEPHGRPAVPGSDLHFSLSHSGDQVLLAFGPTPVGVDVERLPDAAVADELAATLHPRETAELGRLASPEDRVAGFGRCWCRKEAYLKGIGTGLGVSPDVDYLGTGHRPAVLTGWTLVDLRVAGGYAAAVAYAAPAPPSEDESGGGVGAGAGVGVSTAVGVGPPDIRDLSAAYRSRVSWTDRVLRQRPPRGPAGHDPRGVQAHPH
ncbi:4'-phosphopantetheinyl transferase family protein [Streptomyces sp. NPDC006691]|uniref:4'-phosphopantetheinyl transferase family protein n=1 Tax=Streptomyces sp. NPDC006691 TaxID=3364757 RepID=UPI0036C8A817